MRTTAPGTPAHAQSASPEIPYDMTTAQFAALNHVKTHTVYSNYSKTGGFHGVRPLKLATGRTFWPAILVTADHAAAYAHTEGDLHE